MTSSKSPSNLPEHLSTHLSLEFSYDKLDSEIRTVVQQRTGEIKDLMRRTTQEIIEIGQKLTDVKAQLGHGNFRVWLKTEFDWSIPTANRFMQVAQKFKCLNLRHLDITASALYLLASPSKPEEARTEALKRASLGENITYTKAKAIVSKYKKAAKPQPEEPIILDVDPKTVECDSTKCIEQKENESSSVLDMVVGLTGKEAEKEARLLSNQDLVSPLRFKDKLIVANVDRNREQLEDTTPIPASIVNQTVTAQKIPDTTISEIEIRIKQLPPEQLAQMALVIINYAKDKLNKCYLEAIITTAQQALD